MIEQDAVAGFSVAGQLVAVAGSAVSRRARRFNPLPPGSMAPSGTPAVVLAFLRAAPGFKTEGQIVFATGRSRSAVSWALLTLTRRGLIRAIPDAIRNARYRRYAALTVD